MTTAGGEQEAWWDASGVRALLTQRQLAVACFDADVRCLAASPALERQTGRSAEALRGRTPRQMAERAGVDVDQACLDALATGAAVHELQCTLQLGDDPAGEQHWLLDIYPVPSDQGPIGLVVVARDVTEPIREDRARAEATDALVLRTRSDPLTGLANRTALFAELGTALEAGSSVSVVFCDLDGFKEINDRHGHTAGDQVLRAVARRIRWAARSGDLTVRFGGDEFLVLVRAVLDDEGLAEITERYRTAIAQPVYVEGVRFDLKVSIGAATAGPGDSADDLIRTADHRMYEDKRANRPAERSPPAPRPDPGT